MLSTFEAPSIPREDSIGLPDTTQGLDGHSDWSAHGPASESHAARPTPGVFRATDAVKQGGGGASPLAARQAGRASRAGSDAFTRSAPWARRLKLLATRSTV